MSSRAPGGSSRRSTTTTRGQPAASTSGGGASGAKPTTRVGLDRRRGRHDRPRARRRACARSSSTSRACHVGDAFLLQRLVGVVDDDRGREIGNRRERGDPAADDDAARPRAARRHASVRCRVGLVGVQRTRPRGPRRARYCASDRARATRRRRTRSSTRRPRTATRPAPAGRATAAAAPPPPNRRRLTPASRRSADAGSAGSGVRATLLGGDAERSTATRGPDQRHAIQSVEGDDVGAADRRTTTASTSSRRSRRSRARRRRRRPSRAPAGRAAGRARSCRRARSGASASGTR